MVVVVWWWLVRWKSWSYTADCLNGTSRVLRFAADGRRLKYSNINESREREQEYISRARRLSGYFSSLIRKVEKLIHLAPHAHHALNPIQMPAENITFAW